MSGKPLKNSGEEIESVVNGAAAEVDSLSIRGTAGLKSRPHTVPTTVLIGNQWDDRKTKNKSGQNRMTNK